MRTRAGFHRLGPPVHPGLAGFCLAPWSDAGVHLGVNERQAVLVGGRAGSRFGQLRGGVLRIKQAHGLALRQPEQRRQAEVFDQHCIAVDNQVGGR